MSLQFEGRFDHAVVLVRDLALAALTYEEIGFSVSAGGRHEGVGTHNALVRFGVDYLELLAVRDVAAARATANARAVVDLLESGRGGLASFALATNRIEVDAERLRRTGLAAVGPFAMERLRPDGRRLSWRLLIPEGRFWRVPWPFLIQWDQPDATRLAWERPTIHANGAHGVLGVTVAVRDLEQAAILYERKLGIAVSMEERAPDINARRRTAHLGSFEIRLCTPAGQGWLSERLRDLGEGIYEVAIATHRAERHLIEPESALGARLTFRSHARARD